MMKNIISNKKKISMIPLYKLFPSIITIIAMCLGITAIHYSMHNKFQIAVTLILIASLLDAVDGKVARFLNSTSEFGAQLDSLADLVNFGVTPAIIMYSWALEDMPYPRLGWAMTLVYIICSALRLARFNTMHIIPLNNLHNIHTTEKAGEELGEIENETTNGNHNNIHHNTTKNNIYKNHSFFIGLPMPGAALLCLSPMIITFELFQEFKISPIYIAFHMFVIGILMVSKIPTISFKHFKIMPKYISLVFITFWAIVAFIIIEPWVAIPFFTFLYCVSIPITSYLQYFSSRRKKNHNKKLL